MSIFKSVLLGGMLLLSSSVALAQVSLSQNSSGSNVFSLVGKKDKACVYYDAQDFEVVKTTAGLFANDVKEVSGQILGVATTKEAPQKNCIIVGTLGHNEWIDQMIAKKKLDVEPLKDRWESYLVQLVRNPLPGVDKALVIVGSDRRGAAYGLLSVSRTIGVSPWYWWADAPIVKKDQLHLKVDKYISKEPTVKYRGIFINDEDWGLKRSLLGVFWSFLNPLLNMAVQYVVFSNLFRFDIPYFPVYLLCGNVIFTYFSESCGMALTSIVGNAGLITKVYVPKYIYPLTRILSSLINLLISMIPLIAVALISGLLPAPAYILSLYAFVCLALFCLGLGMLLSAAMVFFRDIQFLWGVLTTIWMYLTPIFYPVSALPEAAQRIVMMNPLYYYVTFVRTCIIDGVSPEPTMYAQCLLYAIAALVVGAWVFKKNQDKFVLYL